MRRHRWWIVGGVVVALAAAGAVVALRAGGGSGLPHREVDAYLASWSRFDGAGMARLVDRPPADFAPSVTSMRTGLQVTKATFTADKLRRRGGGVDASYRADVELAGLGRWRYSGVVHLDHGSAGWRVRWSPSLLHPALGVGQHLGRSRTWPARAPILGSDGAPLVQSAEVVVVGLEPDRVRDRAQIATALHDQLAVDPAAVAALLDRPGVPPTAFVPVAAVTLDRYNQLRPVLAPVPGIFFRRSLGRQLPVPGFAQHVIGRVGDVTADRLKELGAPYVTGDQVGLSGLEAAFERQLAGAPSGEVRVVDAGGAVVRVLDRFPGTDAQPVRTTLDGNVQRAAERALSGVAQPAALVAIDAASGDIRAVVSRPLDQPFDRALAGRYPPGSTFKVVTTVALVAHGVGPDTPATCPPRTTVGGKVFVNFEGEAAPTIPFHTAFALSCNTAFVGLAANLPAGALVDAAAGFGFGERYRLPLTSFGAELPTPADAAERAAAAIGQARVQASPLHMATVAAAVAGGAWRPPRLLADDPQGVAKPLDAHVLDVLRGLMAEVVRGGTGTAAAVPGQDVRGKTGTAEFGSANPPTTHAWFVGFRGNLAFAVLVEGGGIGGRVAAPLAAGFVAALPA